MFWRIFWLGRIIYWLAIIALGIWLVSLYTRKRPEPKFVGIPEFNRLFAQESKGEKASRTIFEDFYGRPFVKDSKAFRNPVTGRFLELDGVNYELRLAFEYNGKHHYNDIQQAQRDVIKRHECDARNIYLVPIPHDVRDIRRYVANLLPSTLDAYLVDDKTREFVREIRGN